MARRTTSSLDNDVRSASGCIVCVFGISGVGKTTLIQQYVIGHEHWRALSASELLTRLSGRDSSAHRLSERTVLERNQFWLADAIYRELILCPGEKWLLDVHSVLDNDRELVPVPASAIRRLHPDQLIFLFDGAEQIWRRRWGDTGRKRPLPSVDRIDQEQNLALETCLEYSAALELELYRVQADDFAAFSAVVGKAQQ
jgi:adenylate kinase